VNEAYDVRYWTEALGCSEDELAAAVARVGNSADAVQREIYRHWAYGTLRKTEYRDGDEDDRASGPEDARCAPAASSGVAVANERFSCGALTTHRRRERAGAAVVAATGPPSQ
jgi:Protein of unknown function (DUF3606)